MKPAIDIWIHNIGAHPELWALFRNQWFPRYPGSRWIALGFRAARNSL